MARSMRLPTIPISGASMPTKTTARGSSSSTRKPSRQIADRQRCPGHKPEYIQVDPQTHDVYQNIATDNEIAVIDPKTLKVKRLIPDAAAKEQPPAAV